MLTDQRRLVGRKKTQIVRCYSKAVDLFRYGKLKVV